MPKRILDIPNEKWFDKLSFPQILGVWLLTIIVFGLVYHFLASTDATLMYSKNHTPVTDLVDSIYFSFVTATTTGFGDIVPIGAFKFIAIFQVVTGLLLLALVTSRLVSLKQDAILTELYDISFKEKINRLRSSLLLFRQSIDRIVSSLEEKEFKPKMLKSINGYLSTFDYTLAEVRFAIDSNKNNRYTKDLDPISVEILYNSTLSSFDKIIEMIDLLEKSKLEWKKDISIGLLSKCLSTNEDLFKILSNASLSQETVKDLEIRKEDTRQRLRSQMYD
jgi:hypothetical protein